MATYRRRVSSISTATTLLSSSVYKIITLGNVSVGKSTLLATYIRGECPRYVPTNNITFREEKFIAKDGKLLQLELWDTVGQERYDSITPNYYRDAHGCLLCFDISAEQSYKDLIIWYRKLQDNCVPAPCTILVGTKSDLRSKDPNNNETLLSLADCTLAAQNLGLEYEEVSSYKTQNVDEVFEKLIDMIDKRRGVPKNVVTESNSGAKTVDLSQNSTDSSSKGSCKC